MKLFEIVDLNISFKSFVFNIIMIIIFGSISSTVIPFLNHYALMPLFNYEIEKYMGIGMWMAIFGIYLGMCLEKSNVRGKNKK